MAAQIFDFPFHTQGTDYPDTNDRIDLGRGWSYATQPSHVGQRTFHLYFEVMKFHVDDAGAPVVVDSAHQGYGYDMLRLIQFYETHGLWKAFVYEHPVFGNINVKFKAPLRIPGGIPGGGGSVKGVEVSLMEEPT